MTHYQLVAKNKRRSFLIVFLFIAFIVGASYVMAKGFGYSLDIVAWALVFSGVTSFFSYFYSDKIILGISGAKEASRKEFFDFYTVTENICMGQKMPMPKLYVIEDSAMNAFATGRNPKHAVVCATTGLLGHLNRSEIEAVVAHEISHVKNYDILLMSTVSVLVGLIALLADWFMRMSFWGGKKRDSDNNQLGAIMAILAIILAILSPIIAQLIQLAISRRREFLADAGSAAISKNPEGLIKALEKISADKEPLESANKATAHLYISNPLKNTKGAVHAFAKLFNTHPPMEERIAALKQMSIK
ncbi:MAG: Protease HtpX-like protein [Candidatus Pacebacteria bacterium GW2011_GWF2_38_9]|nr:MAG: HtpX-2 peptidase, heat shock protein HtpX [candidate division TM6 bacterium GW2011_GWF2_28_16]KKQ08313.1 MAG: Protease HtpX-like protein [Candidatus Pacebacteria bacterium GW2011_GWF1_36_5]KKQ88918.1 MAG: Protease HtpX-like protein [Candidatus Pacebacteria bacterium GW2011_GWF2_38_9]HAZ73094.1 zinc metalloprotease HtpX [Candidatus Paceibacterota bacterium]